MALVSKASSTAKPAATAAATRATPRRVVNQSPAASRPDATTAALTSRGDSSASVPSSSACSSPDSVRGSSWWSPSVATPTRNRTAAITNSTAAQRRRVTRHSSRRPRADGTPCTRVQGQARRVTFGAPAGRNGAMDQEQRREEEELQEKLHRLDDEIEDAKELLESESHEHDETYISGLGDEEPSDDE